MSAPAHEDRLVGGRRTRISERAGKPLLLLVRMAAHDLGLWDHIWPELTNDFTVASFDLTVPPFEGRDPRAVLHGLAEECVAVAQSLGHEKFHFFGWHGGAQVGLRLAIDFRERLHSAALLGPIYEPLERGHTEHLLRLIEATLSREDLEFYTYFWFLTGITPEYAQEHFDRISAMVRRRLELDSSGRLDAAKIVGWATMQRRYVVSDEELARITTPLLLLSAAYSLWPPLHTVRRLAAKIPTAQLGIPRGGDLIVWQEPDEVMRVAGPFLRAAARGTPPVSVVRDGGAIEIYDRSRRIAAVEPAADEAIVFLHGWLMSPAMWAPSVAALRERVRTLAPWQPAHGASSAPPLGFSMDDWADWLAAVLDRSGVRRAVLAGHSMGGMLAMNFLRRYPDRVRGLVLAGTRAAEWELDDKRDFIALADAVGAAWSPELARTCADALLGEDFLESRAGWFGAWCNAIAHYDLPGMSNLARAIAHHPDYTETLARAGVPVFIAHGLDDEAIEVEHARSMAAAVPNAEYLEIPGCAHAPPLERPDAFVPAMLRFLERHGLVAGAQPVPAA